MHFADFLQDMAVVLLVAGAATVACHRLRQPVVLGYLAAGLLIGPHTPPYALISDDDDLIATLADLGVVLLMFGLGLHFSLRQLLAVGRAALVAAVFEIGLMIWLGYGLGRACGWSATDSIFLGALLSISSTTIIAKTLEDLHLVQAGFARVVFGILVVEDLLGIGIIALLPGVAHGHGPDLWVLAGTLGALALFLIAVVVAGLLVIPRVLAYIARTRSDEVLLVAVLGMCFGAALIAIYAKYNVALGAFIAGAVMADTREAPRIRLLVEPVRDMFSAVFFVAVGMLIDPVMILHHLWTVVVITAAVVVGKISTCALGAFVAGTPLAAALRTGAAMAQIGEFSFIIARLGQDLDVTSSFLYPVAVSVSALTTMSTPYLIRFADRRADRLVAKVPQPMRMAAEWYTAWIDRVLRTDDDAMTRIRKKIRTWLLQIALDLALITCAMALAGWFAHHEPAHWMPVVLGGPRTLTWLAAMLFALPLLVHIWYKQRALAMILGELAVPRASAGSAAGPYADRARTVAVLAFQALAMAAVALLLAGVSVTLLPPWPVLVALLMVLAVVLGLGWHRFITLYYRAQVAVMESFAGAPAPPTVEPMPEMLAEAVMIPIPLPAGAAAIGRAIRDLALRSVSGASIIAIERAGARKVNPGPEEKLFADDVVLLFGTEAQVRSARTVLLG